MGRTSEHTGISPTAEQRRQVIELKKAEMDKLAEAGINVKNRFLLPLDSQCSAQRMPVIPSVSLGVGAAQFRGRCNTRIACVHGVV